jgi:hypothetical protein
MDINAAGVRTVRAVIFTALCVTLSAGAHVLLSAAPLPLLPLLAVSAAVFTLAFAAARRELGFARIAALLIPLELTADAVFTSGQDACYGQAGGPVAGPLRSLGVDLLCGGGEFGAPLARVTGASHSAHSGAQTLPFLSSQHAAWAPWLLLAVHVAVGLVAAAWLRRGEAALARTLGAASTSAFRAIRPLLLAFAARRRTGESVGDDGESVDRRLRGACALPPETPHALPLLTHSVHRRGPPPVVRAA